MSQIPIDEIGPEILRRFDGGVRALSRASKLDPHTVSTATRGLQIPTLRSLVKLLEAVGGSVKICWPDTEATVSGD